MNREHKFLSIGIIGFAIMLLWGCEKGMIRDSFRNKKPDTYNFKFIGYDFNIENPESDRRCYYKIFLDKIEVGRTTIGLESQDKVYEGNVQANRHLLSVEKWVLDEKQGKYVKLNNIDQPRPNYVYFGSSEGSIALITLKNDMHNNSSVFEIDLEHE